jgi:hypothetical protein
MTKRYDVFVSVGRIGGRKTENTYSHAVVALQVARTRYAVEGEQCDDKHNVIVEPITPRWVICSFHSREALALKAAAAEYLTGDKKVRRFLRERRSCFEQIQAVPVLEAK